jgi:hypothetical protein
MLPKIQSAIQDRVLQYLDLVKRFLSPPRSIRRVFWRHGIVIIRAAQFLYVVTALSIPIGAYEAMSGVPAFAQTESINAVRIEQLKDKNIQIDTHLAASDKRIDDAARVLGDKIDANHADDNKRFEDVTDRQWWMIGVGAGAIGFLGVLQGIMMLGLKITKVGE